MSYKYIMARFSQQKLFRKPYKNSQNLKMAFQFFFKLCTNVTCDFV